MDIPRNFWEKGPEWLFEALEASTQGLSDSEADARISSERRGLPVKKRGTRTFSLFIGQFKNPIILILLAAVVVSFVVGDMVDATIILAIIALSGFLGFVQERNASKATERLLTLVKTRADVIRGGERKEIPADEVVPGDIVLLSAGDRVPTDGLILETKDFFVNEAIFTGESFPVEKGIGPQASKSNAVFMGTNVMSGTAKLLAVRTGPETEFGTIAGRLSIQAETDFERGVKRFGYFLMEVTLVLVLIVFAVNVQSGRPVIEGLMFSLALAVGLTPQLLPAIITVNLAKGSSFMSRKGVIVKRLASIENFGTMDCICMDKTGTLTEGIVQLRECLDTGGEKNERVLLFASLNASFQTGLKNPIDEAVVKAGQDLSGYEKLDEIPYDFERKRLSVVVRKGDEVLLISKGALENILEVSKMAESAGAIDEIGRLQNDIERRYNEWSAKGLRVLGVAFKKVEPREAYKRTDESGMTFLGFLLFDDPPKADAANMVSELNRLGIEVKIITGDNRFISGRVAEEIGFSSSGVVTGGELEKMSDEAIEHAAARANVFAEVNPLQKEKLITSLKKAGRVVGYMGDGINDAPAIRAADVGISVNTAVDVAKEAADIVLLQKDLRILRDGVVEGRKTFANTMKYVFMATSANFGNMFSMAGASLFLPFLPMLPKQILLANLLTDLPEMTIAGDRVEDELIHNPRKWDIVFIKRFMIFFGVLSSVFDYVTFGVLLFVLKATPEMFRTGWFIESVASASLAVLLLRTKRPVLLSRPGKYLFAATVAVVAFVLALPYLPFSRLMDIIPVPYQFLEALALILVAYMLLIEAAKSIFYRKIAAERKKT